MRAEMNCLERAMKAANGKLTEQEVMDAMEHESKLRQAFIDAGKTDNLDARVAQKIAQMAMDKKVEAARMKRQIAQNIKARSDLDMRVASFQKAGLDPVKALRATWEGTQRNVEGGRVSGYAQAQAYESNWLGSIFSTIQKEKPHLINLLTDKNFDNDVTKELFELREGGKPGLTGNSDAQYMAKVLAAHMEVTRTELNRLGAAIGKLDGYSGPQVHDDLTMLRVSSGQWVKDIWPLLDLDRTFPDMEDKSGAPKALQDIYQTIITGVSNHESPLLHGKRVSPGSMGGRLGKDRVLHFKDAQSAIAYRDLYGRGSTLQGIFGQIKNHAHYAGAMDVYGPNPKAMILSMAERMQKDLKAKTEGMAPGKERDKLVAQMNSLAAHDGEVGQLKSTIDAITGVSSRPVNIGMAKIGNSIRAWEAMSKLGGAVLTAMPTDTVTMAAAAMFRGQGFWKGLFKSFGEFAGQKSAKDIGFLLGEGFDEFTGHLATHANDGPVGTLSKVTQTYFKWSGLSGWTDAARSVSARMTAAHLGLNRDLKFSELDARLAYVLKLNGIDEPKWNAIRSVGALERNGNHYITPDLIRGAHDDVIMPIVQDKIDAMASAVRKNKDGMISDEAKKQFMDRSQQIIEQARKDLEMDLHRYYADEASYAVLEGDAASRRVSTFGTRPGTIAGEAVRFVMQFKGFPIAFAQRILGRAVFNAPTGRMGQAGHVGSMMAGLTIAGYMAMAMKDMAKGVWPPQDPFSKSTWLAAFARGGGLGIYGDLLIGQQSKYGHGPIETLSGPSVTSFSDVYNMWQDIRNAKSPSDAKKKALGDSLNFAINNTPFANLFYTRAAIDTLFINSLREAISPGTIARQQQALQHRTGQKYVIPRTLSNVF